MTASSTPQQPKHAEIRIVGLAMKNAQRIPAGKDKPMSAATGNRHAQRFARRRLRLSIIANPAVNRRSMSFNGYRRWLGISAD